MAEWLHEVRFRIKALFHRRRLRREMAEELDFHQAMLRQKLSHEGTAPERLDSSVRQTFGDARRWQERLAELWQIRWLENLLRDVLFGLRILRKSPGFTAVALLTLILGIGANTAIFNLINALLLRPLPVPQAEQLVVLGTQQEQAGYSFCEPLIRSLERRYDILQNVFAYTQHSFQIKTRDGIQSVNGSLVSGEYFDALQTRPQLGRYLEAADDRPGGNPSGLAVVISDQFWRKWFNGAPDVIGRKLILDNVPFTVAGVMPRSFIGADPMGVSEIYAALAVEPLVDAPFNMMAGGFRYWWLTVAGRRRSGMDLAQTNAALRAASRSLIEDAGPEDANWLKNAKSGKYHLFAEPNAKGFSYLRLQFRRPLLIVFALCCSVLLLACLNLASLLMARAAAREREMATRLAIGASRRRLMQQLLVESFLLAGFGAAAGLAVSPLASRALAAMLVPGRYNSQFRIGTNLDGRVFLFAVITAIVSALLVGALPAIQATTGALNEHLKDNVATFRASRHRRILPRFLLSSEVALALVVVFGASLLAASLVRLYRVGMGFNPNGVTLASLSMDKQPLENMALLRLYQELGEAYEHIHGVQSVSYSDITPISGASMTYIAHSPGNANINLHMARVGPDYFHTMRIELLAGREFQWNDLPSSGKKIVLNQAALRQLFSDGRGLGRHVDLEKTDYEVIAVVGNTKYEDLRREEPPTGYMSITQEEDFKKISYTAILRIDGPTAPVISEVRSTTARMVPEIPAPVFTSMNSQINESLTSERMMAILAVFFAVCALLVTGIGLYGTLAYSTARRTSEIGIRMALGAQRKQVALLIFRENAVVAIIGSLIGLGVALLSARALTAQLYNTSTHDVFVMLLSVGALGIIACIASLLPALRAARIEPMEAIRRE